MSTAGRRVRFIGGPMDGQLWTLEDRVYKSGYFTAAVPSQEIREAFREPRESDEDKRLTPDYIHYRPHRNFPDIWLSDFVAQAVKATKRPCQNCGGIGTLYDFRDYEDANGETQTECTGTYECPICRGSGTQQ